MAACAMPPNDIAAPAADSRSEKNTRAPIMVSRLCGAWGARGAREACGARGALQPMRIATDAAPCGQAAACSRPRCPAPVITLSSANP